MATGNSPSATEPVWVRVMPGFTPRGAAGRLVLADDESDLVFHIVCSRDRMSSTLS